MAGDAIARALEAAARASARVNTRERLGNDPWVDDARWAELLERWRELPLDERHFISAYDIPAKESRAAIAAFLRSIEPTPEMMRAWVAAVTAGHMTDAQLDELEPEFGTGQGDLRMCPHWQNIATAFHLHKRESAALSRLAEQVEGRS